MMFEDEKSNIYAGEIVPNQVCSLKFSDKTTCPIWASSIKTKHEMSLDVYKVAMGVIFKP